MGTGPADVYGFEQASFADNCGFSGSGIRAYSNSKSASGAG